MPGLAERDVQEQPKAKIIISEKTAVKVVKLEYFFIKFHPDLFQFKYK